ncbi:MAG: 4-(cytidine 5'-diphospho)-2-C-methyl-D-erythritol kinase [Hyphomicrobium sp.]
MPIFREFAPAKINLTLEVLGKRADGFHELASLVAFARDAGDDVTLDTSRPTGSSVVGPFGATIAGKNLIDVTLGKLAAADAGLVLGHVTLTKNLPVAAGIGGGSADAAAVLRAVRRANPDRAERIDWQSIALSLGADVPVCLFSQSAIMGGIGEIVVPACSLSPLAVVLVNPRVPVPADKTAQVFRRLNARPLPADFVRQLWSPFFESPGGFRRYMAERPNALESAAMEVVPEIAAIKQALLATPRVMVSGVSGGGPTCFAVYESLTDAQSAGDHISARYPSWWVAASRVVRNASDVTAYIS